LAIQAPRFVRRYLRLPLSEWLIEFPRLVARVVSFALPLFLTYSASRPTPVEGQLVYEPLYPYRWPFWVLLAAIAVAAIYKVWRGSADQTTLRQRRFLALSTGGSLKQLQAVVRACPDEQSLDTIRAGLLTIIVDKTKELLQETASDVYTANLMIADDAKRTLSLVQFSREHSGRRRIDLAYGAPGAGVAIQEGRPVYIPDIRDPDLKALFREDAPYRSILSLPVICAHQRVGVVNVDSTKPEDLPMDLLADHLDPYVQLIGLALDLERRLASPMIGRRRSDRDE